MSKLIHSLSLATIKTKTPLLYADSEYTQVAKSGIIFTDDGYMVVRGKEFKIALANATLSAEIDQYGVLKVTDSVGFSSTALLPVYDADRGLTVVNYKVGHSNTALADDVIKTLSGVSIVNYVLKQPTITYDKYGHITAYTADSTNGVHLDYVTSSATTSDYILLGHSEAGTSAAVLNTTIKVSFASGTAVLNVPKLNVSNGTDGIIVGTKTDNSIMTLSDYIEEKVKEANTQAMEYKGAIDPSTGTSSAGVTLPTLAVNGDTYKVSADGYVKIGTDNIKVKQGDVLIAKVVNSTLTWDVIPAGDETETFIKYNGTNYSSVIEFVNDADYPAFTFDAANQKFTFKNTTYSDYTVAGTAAGMSGLVPAPEANTETYRKFLSDKERWVQINYSDLAGTPTIGAGALSLYLGQSQLVSSDFTANSTTAVTYNIPLATGTALGVVLGYAEPTSPVGDSWTQAAVVDGVIKYYDHTYQLTASYANTTGVLKIATFKQTGASTGTDVYIPAATAKGNTNNEQGTYGLVRSSSAVTDVTNYLATPIVDGIPYYLNSWRPVKAWKLSELGANSDTIDVVRNENVPGTGTANLVFGSTFAWVDKQGDTTVSDPYIDLVWAEVGDDGKITYEV